MVERRLVAADVAGAVFAEAVRLPGRGGRRRGEGVQRDPDHAGELAVDPRHAVDVVDEGGDDTLALDHLVQQAVVVGGVFLFHLVAATDEVGHLDDGGDRLADLGDRHPVVVEVRLHEEVGLVDEVLDARRVVEVLGESVILSVGGGVEVGGRG